MRAPKALLPLAAALPLVLLTALALGGDGIVNALDKVQINRRLNGLGIL